MLECNAQAPEIALRNQSDEEIHLSDYHGKKVVLYFYPKDNTPGCSRQAVAFAAAYDAFRALGTEVIGVSRDSVASHVRFADKYQLPFTLLSDPELTAIQAYCVWQEKKLYGKTSMGVIRTTFLIDEDGRVEKIWNKVKPDANASEVLDYLRAAK